MRVFFILILVFIVLSCDNVKKAEKKNIQHNKINEIVMLEKIIYKDIDIEREFDKNFLKAISKFQIKSILKKYKEGLGKLVKIRKEDKKYIVLGENGKCEAKIVLDKNKIIALWFNSITPKEDSFESVLDDFKKLDGKKSIIVLKDNKEILKYNPDKKLAVGSTFKLYVLRALENKIKAEKISWDFQIPLDKNNYSLPSGILQNWPEGTKLSLRVLSNLMISLSDNTATDHLIDFVTREKIEELSQLKPFLKTSEMFKIKWGINKKFKNKYLNSNKDEKIKILEKYVKIFNLKDVKFKNLVTDIDKIEWFFSTKELAKLIYLLKDNPSLRINLGFVEKDKYFSAAYKGGSEPGVLNYTFLIQKNKNSEIYTISLTINSDKLIETNRFSDFVIRIIALIK